jgi:hypothetical protein
MPASTLHPDYIKAAPRYKLIRDIVNNDAMCHIRSPEPDNPDSKRNEQYKKDGILTNFTNLTREGLTGLIFRKKLKLSLPPELNYLIEDFNGSGINIYQFSQYAASEVLQTGRMGLLIDFYNNSGKVYIKPYCAESITNWKTKVYNGVVKNSSITLKESVDADPDDPFDQTKKDQYRVLRLDASGFYFQEIYDDEDNLISSQYIKDYNGNFLDQIPFVFIGSQNNDQEIDPQPLYDLAILNLGHYRNSCDYEESIFICGQPYLVIDPGDVSKEDFDDANKGGLAFGSRKALVLGAGGKPVLLQANANQLAAQAMSDKLAEAARIGARLIEAAGGRETAEAARIRYGAQHSALYTLTSNIGWAVTKSLKIACQFMNANEALVKYVLNKDFYEDTADPNLIAQQMLMIDKGIITKDEVRQYAERTGIIENEENDLYIPRNYR